MFVKVLTPLARAVLLSLILTAFAYAHQCDLSRPQLALSQSKEALGKDRWDARAQACLSLIYYRLGDRFRVMKVLRDAEEQLPQWVIDQIHQHLWIEAPELLAYKEFSDQYTLSGGDCMIKNTSMIDGNGYLIIGDFLNPHTKKVTRHLAAYKCNWQLSNCRESNLICPECTIERPEAVVKVQDYKVIEVYQIEPELIERNLRYIKTVLELQRLRYAR
jgi:hypothetical protein